MNVIEIPKNILVESEEPSLIDHENSASTTAYHLDDRSNSSDRNTDYDSSIEDPNERYEYFLSLSKRP